jgi:hypothetical protein
VGAQAGAIKAAADARIQEELKKAGGGLSDAQLFQQSMKVFGDTTRQFTEAVDKLSGAKIELTGNMRFDVNVVGLQGGNQALQNLVQAEVLNAVQNLAANKLKGVGPIGPADLGMPQRKA